MILVLQVITIPIANAQLTESYYYSQELTNYSSLEWNVNKFQVEGGWVEYSSFCLGFLNNITKIKLNFNTLHKTDLIRPNIYNYSTVFVDNKLINDTYIKNYYSDIGFQGFSGLISGRASDGGYFDTFFFIDFPLILWTSRLYDYANYFRFSNDTFKYINVTENIAKITMVSTWCAYCKPPSYYNQTYLLEKDTGIVLSYELKLRYDYTPSYKLFYADVNYVLKKTVMNRQIPFEFPLNFATIGILGFSGIVITGLLVEIRNVNKLHQDGKLSFNKFLNLKPLSSKKSKKHKQDVSEDKYGIIDEIIKEDTN